MSRYSGRLPRTYADADRMLGKRAHKRLLNNTYAVRGGDGRVNIIHHNSIIGAFDPDGSVMLTNAGYGSVSTRERLNAMAPAGVGFVQRNHAQMIAQRHQGNEHLTPGGTVQIAPDGTVSV